MEVVAAFDIGSSYCGYAFSSKREFEDDMFNIHLNEQWMSGHANLHTYKVLSCLLLTNEKSLFAFGYEAEKKHTQLLEGKQHDQFFYFRRFCAPFKTKQLRKDSVVEEDGGKSMNAIALYAIVLKYMKSHFLEELGEGGTDKYASSESLAKGHMVKYVVTIPAKWDHVARDCMKAACKKAGVAPVTIVTESEAAARYCGNLPLRASDHQPFYIQRPGSRHVIVDIGGTGIDTVIQEVTEDGSIKEISKNLGNASVGHRVDVEFIKFMHNLFGTDIMEFFAKKYKMDYLDLQYEFEVRKRSFSLESDTVAEIDLPPSLIKLYVSKHKQSIQFLIDDSDYVGKIISRDDTLILDKPVMKDIFGPAVKSVVGYISNLSRDPEVKQADAIILVGGFIDSQVVSGALKFYFPNANILIPEEGELAVLIGGVLAGHNPRSPDHVTSKYSIGLGMAVPFKEGVHPAKKMFKSGANKLCCDVFKSHIELGKTVTCGEMSRPSFLTTNRVKQQHIVVPVYASNNKRPGYTTDDGCVLLGKLSVRKPKDVKSNPNLKILMTIVGSSLIVEASNDAERISAQQSFRLSRSRPSSY